jgi:hypothetical protein
MLHIDDREAAMREVRVDTLIGVGVCTFFVGSSVSEATAHFLCR